MMRVAPGLHGTAIGTERLRLHARKVAAFEHGRSVALGLRLCGVRDDSLPKQGVGAVVARHDLRRAA